MLNISKEQKSIEELEKDFWAPLTEYPTSLVQNIYHLRKKPVCYLEVEDIRLLITQSVGLKYLVPLAIQLLEADVLQEALYYPGDLLAATLTIGPNYWEKNPLEKERFDALLNRSMSMVLKTDLINDEIKMQLLTASRNYSYGSNGLN